MNREPINPNRIPCAYGQSGAVGNGRLTIMSVQGKRALIAYRSEKTCRCGMIKRVPVYGRKGKVLGVIVRGRKVPFKRFAGTGFGWRAL